MKQFYTVFAILCCFGNTYAANLTATVMGAGFGKKDGKITLNITGGNAPYTISWTGPGGFTSTKQNPDMLGAGTYCVTVTDQYCGTATMCVEIKEQANGIPVPAASHLNVYPNPFSGQLFIELGKEITGTVTLRLKDLNGKTVVDHRAEAAPYVRWDLEQRLSPAAYILSAELEDGTQLISRLIISR